MTPTPALGKAVVSLNTGLEDTETVTVAFLGSLTSPTLLLRRTSPWVLRAAGASDVLGRGDARRVAQRKRNHSSEPDSRPKNCSA
jgi:hypothetical protein